MPRPKLRKIHEKDIVGLKYFDQLSGLLSRLHDVGCERDVADNRRLHFDHYCMLILLYLFNPIVTSLRGLQQASELKKVRKKLNCPRTSLGSFSESSAVFEPERLKEIIALIYQYRWTIEIFFRFFKHILGCRHLLSQRKEGIEIQTYCAIIACMLISLWTGRKPTLRTYEMICFFFTGPADEDELLAHIAGLEKSDD